MKWPVSYIVNRYGFKNLGAVGKVGIVCNNYALVISSSCMGKIIVAT